MKIALIGATGFVGSAVLSELVRRDHRVTALVHDLPDVALPAGVTTVIADAYDPDAVSAAVLGHDAVVSAFNPGWDDPNLYENYLRGSAAIVRGCEKSGVARVLMVGGAGSLLVAPGLQLVDTQDFAKSVPSNVVPGARAARDALARLRENVRLEWTFVSPPAHLEHGERTGTYRLGGDFLLMDGDKPAGISVADLAVAIVDEIERPRHVRARFTVAGK